MKRLGVSNKSDFVLQCVVEYLKLHQVELIAFREKYKELLEADENRLREKNKFQ
jgi:hypothetical protein